MPYLNLSVQHIQFRIQDFPEVGVSTLQWVWTHNFTKFPTNCMKLKEFGWPPIIYPGEGGNLCSMLLWTICDSPFVESCMSAWLKLQVNMIFFKDSFVLPVTLLNITIQDTQGRGYLFFTFMWTVHQLPCFDGYSSTWLKLPNTWSY